MAHFNQSGTGSNWLNVSGLNLFDELNLKIFSIFKNEAYFYTVTVNVKYKK